jgi:phenylalanyl-tRNA synthetase beta chain
VSVVAPLKEPVASIEQLLAKLAGEWLVSIEFVRQYSGPPFTDEQKSVSYRLELGASDRTLTSEEVGEVRSYIVSGVLKAGFEVRGLEA